MRPRSSLLFLFVLLAGCTHAISKDLLKGVERSVTFSQIFASPETYEGRSVLVGGVIVRTTNKVEGTLLEVYATALDRQGRPIDTDRSAGRFLALHMGFLDPEIYKQGRKVTIVGTVQGAQTAFLGEILYRYPYLIAKEIHLWEQATPQETSRWEICPCDPWYPWGWYPWWHHPCYHWHH